MVSAVLALMINGPVIADDVVDDFQTWETLQPQVPSIQLIQN